MKLVELRRDVEQLVEEGRLTKVNVTGTTEVHYICSTEHVHLKKLHEKGSDHAKKQLDEIGVILLPGIFIRCLLIFVYKTNTLFFLAFDALTICLKDKAFWFHDAKKEIEIVWKKNAIIGNFVCLLLLLFASFFKQILLFCIAAILLAFGDTISKMTI